VSKSQKRQSGLCLLESSLGASDESSLSFEFRDLSPDGEEIPKRDPHLMAYDHAGKRTLQVVFVDSEGDGGPGPGSLAREERHRKLAREKAPRERGDGRRVRRSRARAQGLKPSVSIPLSGTTEVVP
jgi:hypothetical protein